MSKLRIKQLMGVVNYYESSDVFFDDEANAAEFDEELGGDDFWDWREKMVKISPNPVMYCSDEEGHEMIYSFSRTNNSIYIFPNTNNTDESFTMKEFVTILDIIKTQLKVDKHHCYEVMFGKDDEPNHYTLYHQEPTVFGKWWNAFYKLFSENIDLIKGVFIELDGHKFIITLEIRKEVVV